MAEEKDSLAKLREDHNALVADFAALHELARLRGWLEPGNTGVPLEEPKPE